MAPKSRFGDSKVSPRTITKKEKTLTALLHTKKLRFSVSAYLEQGAQNLCRCFSLNKHQTMELFLVFVVQFLKLVDKTSHFFA